jgi:protein-disulfide isomerase
MSPRIAKRPPAAPESRPPPPPRALWLALALALVGLAISLVLVRLHVRAHAGFRSFCAISETVNCDRVAMSRWSVMLGLPVAVWGVIGYGFAAALAISGLLRRRAGATWPAGALFAFGVVATLASAGLAVVSEFVIGAWCLLCIGSWATALALLVVSWRACAPRGVGAAVRGDLAAVQAHPRRTAAAAIAVVGAIAIAAAVYPRYWAAAAPTEQPGAAAAPRPAAPASAADGTPAAQGSTVVVYSDYECPYCARAHEETRLVLARRPDVRLVHRQFPLDASCNPAVKRTVHPTACGLARAGICAEAQGRLAEMDDALFRNQEKNRPVRDLATDIGLDVPRFEACLDAPSTKERLSSDIAAGIRDGVRATPTYVVNGAARAGAFPVDLLPPAPGVPAASR